MEQTELKNVMCLIKEQYRAAILGRVCRIREVNDNQAVIDIFEHGEIRKCTVPLECLDISNNNMTIGRMANEIRLLASRYLGEHDIQAMTPQSDYYKNWCIMKEFLHSWRNSAIDDAFYSSVQTTKPKIYVERSDSPEGFVLGESGNGMSLLAKAKTVESLIQSDDPVAEANKTKKE